jgi:iron complex transport system substrate-binding protein
LSRIRPEAAKIAKRHSDTHPQIFRYKQLANAAGAEVDCMKTTYKRAPGPCVFLMLLAICAGMHFGCAAGNRAKERPADEDAGSALSSGEPKDPRLSIRYAKVFTIEQRRGYRIVRVLSPWRNAKTACTYVLAPRGMRIPDMEAGAIRVTTPVRRIVVTSTTHVAYLAMLGLEDAIAGIVGCKRVATPSVAARIRAGFIKEVGDGSGMTDEVDMEQLFILQPDLIMAYGMGNPEFDRQDKIQEAGFTVALNAEYMETTPLGRTEWLKFIAAFFDKDKEAERLFDAIARRYESLAAKTRSAGRRPTVFCGENFRGVWHVPGGGSYMAALLRDAGAAYIWADDADPGNIPVSVETILERAQNADVWLDPGLCRSREELAGKDERGAYFRAFRTGRVFNNNARMNAGGGNEIWETGVANPDRVLADLISIFHPELLPHHRRTWYWQLPEKESRP